MVQPSGTKGWVMRFRWEGTQCKLTLGPYGDREGELTLKDARLAGDRVLSQLRQGINPIDTKNGPLADQDLFENVYAEFHKRHIKRLAASTARSYENNFEADVLPYWTGRNVKELKRRDVKTRLNEILDERDAPAQANQTYARLKKFFNWCIEEEIIDASPMARMPKPADQSDRTRVLSDDEIRHVWLAADKIGFPYGTVIKGLILTGQRKTEVADLPRKEIIMKTADLNEPHWLLPSERAKNRREHVVPLAPEMLTLLTDLPKLNTNPDMYFVNNRGNRLDGWSDAKSKIDYEILVLHRKAAIERGEDPATVEAMEEWVFHDLRRTVATKMGALRIQPHVIEAVLNHAGIIKGVAKVYNRYSYVDEKRHALELWARTLMRIVNPAGNVIEFVAA
jgi:integrase